MARERDERAERPPDLRESEAPPGDDLDLTQPQAHDADEGPVSPGSWQIVGEASSFKIGQTVQVTILDPSPLAWAGLAERTAVWLRRESEESFKAFAVNCTHLGCPVRWVPDASLFLCPCHGGVFYADGTVAGGPPPRPLVEYQVRMREGFIEVLAGGSPLA